MTEFSELCGRIIEHSNTNVYQLSKSSGLDRTTLQKMLKGDRLPSIQFVIDMCSFLKVNITEEKELLRLYQIEKIGKNVYLTRKEIQSLIADMQLVRKVWAAPRNYSYQMTSLESDVSETRHLELKLDIEDALRIAVIDEIASQENPDIYFDVYEKTGVIMQQLIKEESRTSKKIKCHQNIKLYRRQDKDSSSVDNIKVLKLVLPFAYAFRNTLDSRFTYIDSNKKDELFQHWPHYMITSTQCILISADENNALVINTPAIVEEYRNEIKRIGKLYSPLFAFYGVAENAVEQYMKVIQRNQIPSAVIESHPCISRLFTQQMVEDWTGNDYVRMLSAYSTADTYLCNEKSLSYFGMKDMMSFIRDGRLPGMYGQYFRTCSVQERKEMLEHFCSQLNTDKWESYLINEDLMPIDSGFYIEIYGTQILVMISTNEVEHLSIICIEEKGICEAFLDYFQGLKKSEYVYDTDKTMNEMKNIIKNSFD